MTKLLTLAEAAAMLGTPEATLRYWHQRGKGPKSFRLGKRRMYRLEDLEAFVEEQMAKATA